MRKTISLAKEVDFENLSPEEPDSLVDYVVELFGHQFTRDELYDGLASQDLLPTLTRCFNEVVGAMRVKKRVTGEPMDPQDFIDQLYLNLLKQGWTLNEIDTMDIICSVEQRAAGGKNMYRPVVVGKKSRISGIIMP